MGWEMGLGSLVPQLQVDPIRQGRSRKWWVKCPRTKPRGASSALPAPGPGWSWEGHGLSLTCRDGINPPPWLDPTLLVCVIVPGRTLSWMEIPLHIPGMLFRAPEGDTRPCLPCPSSQLCLTSDSEVFLIKIFIGSQSEPAQMQRVL